MKAGQIISMIDELKENEVNDEIKLFWLNEVEGRVCSEVLKREADKQNVLISLDDELSIPHPYTGLYALYLRAMIAFWEGDYEAYSTVFVEFERMLSDYSRVVIRSR